MKSRSAPFAESSPVPIVKEMDGNTGWDEWSRAVQQQEAGSEAFAPTHALPLQAAAAAAAREEAMLQQLMETARSGKRVCPKPEKWLAMYALLEASGATAPLPPRPLTGLVWQRTPAGPKRMSFTEHLLWAAANGCLPAVHAFIASLEERDWHHMA